MDLLLPTLPERKRIREKISEEPWYIPLFFDVRMNYTDPAGIPSTGIVFPDRGDTGTWPSVLRPCTG